ncbi:solute carrier family 35 member E4 [Sminthopsis crassicaudata]|uniref:solute carrier family 35 member E4 n=1 Tax=Sminthopsis crassicaudata TaxID=9301 RepID=UPI003D687713
MGRTPRLLSRRFPRQPGGFDQWGQAGRVGAGGGVAWTSEAVPGRGRFWPRPLRCAPVSGGGGGAGPAGVGELLLLRRRRRRRQRSPSPRSRSRPRGGDIGRSARPRRPGPGTAARARGPAPAAAAPRDRPGHPPPRAGPGTQSASTGLDRRAPGPRPPCASAPGMSSADGAPAAALPLPWKLALRARGPGPGGPGRVLATVLVWLVAGTGMSSLNKWIFAVHGFRYPLLLSALHMLAAVLVGYPLAGRRARGPLAARARRRVFLLSLTFCATMACGNLGLTYVHLDFAQMVYTTTPLFTLALSRALLGKRHHPLQYAAMGPICLGAACSIMGEMHFHRAGCCFLFAATFLRGLKSVQQSVLLREERLDSVALLYLTSLPSFCLLLGAALVLELGGPGPGPAPTDHGLWLLLLLSCLLSVLYNLASFSLLALTSALTVHVLGNFHVVGNLALSWLLFGSRLSGLSYVGIALTLLGMFLYHNCHLVASWWTLGWMGRPARAP